MTPLLLQGKLHIVINRGLCYLIGFPCMTATELDLAWCMGYKTPCGFNSLERSLLCWSVLRGSIGMKICQVCEWAGLMRDGAFGCRGVGGGLPASI